MLKTLFATVSALTLATSANAALVFDYQLNGDLSDAQGGSGIVTESGTLGPTGYSFGPNQGLTITAPTIGSMYSIETRFSFDTTNGYRKILDFKDRASDTGLYNLSGQLNFFPITSGNLNDFVPGQLVDVLVTRDAAGIFNGYINGNLSISFNDTSNFAVFDNPSNLIRLFQDDFPTGQSEASGGFVDFVRIYDTAILPGAGAVPEPATWAFMVFGFGAIGGAMRRQRKANAKVSYA